MRLKRSGIVLWSDLRFLGVIDVIDGWDEINQQLKVRLITRRTLLKPLRAVTLTKCTVWVGLAARWRLLRRGRVE